MKTLSLVLCFTMSFPLSVAAQVPARDAGETLPEASTGTGNVVARGTSVIKRLAGDQKAIWTSPVRLERRDAVWALPALAGAGLLLASDSWISKQIPTGEILRSRGLSNFGANSLVGGAGAMFFSGNIVHNDHLAETGLLAGEAAVNAATLDLALKSMFQRQRPYEGAGGGNFFSGGSSFPSEHATVSWAIAGVIAHEYPGPLSKFMAYGLASAVSVARVTGKQHFPADVITGGALGYFIAQQLYHRRSDPEVSESAWQNPIETPPPFERQDKFRSPRHMGSPYLPLDSWVYPALERLSALGYLSTAFLGLRPWTRMECARLLDEMEENLRYQGEVLKSDGQEIYSALQSEFRPETARWGGAANLGLRFDSIYTRTTAISGPTLRDGYHFGQTLTNDYGRPYGAGYNQVAGFSASAVAGIFSFSLQAEYQHAPFIASNPLYVLQVTAAEDGAVIPLADGSPRLNRLRIIEGSIGLTLNQIKLSFGKQNLWLGPGESGSLLLSNNAAPITMLQIDNVSPFALPGLSRVLGPVRVTSFLGQLSGQNWVYNPSLAEGLNPTVNPRFLVGPGFRPQPFIHGNKISFHPTPNLELGFGVTAIFGGPGLPFTLHEFFRSYYSHNANIASNPGKRFSSFDVTYRVPGLRKWLTVYTDSLVGDEVSPLGSTRPMINPGIYFPQLPKLPRLELRVEGFKAEPRLGTIYIDRRYRSGYSNEGSLIGSWIGRQALGGQAWLKYLFTPRSSLELGYRHQEVDRFLAGGGRLNDFSFKAGWQLSQRFQLSARAQYENWKFPALDPAPAANFSSTIQMTICPFVSWTRN